MSTHYRWWPIHKNFLTPPQKDKYNKAVDNAINAVKNLQHAVNVIYRVDTYPGDEQSLDEIVSQLEMFRAHSKDIYVGQKVKVNCALAGAIDMPAEFPDDLQFDGMIGTITMINDANAESPICAVEFDENINWSFFAHMLEVAE